MKEKADLAASVAARLLNRAKGTGDEHQWDGTLSRHERHSAAIGRLIR